MKRLTTTLITLSLVALLLGACISVQAPEAQPTSAAIANPASENCIKQGGTLSIVARGDGGQYGICFFEDNRQCEEWALLRGDCPAGGIKVTGYVTPAAQYCAITGGAYAVTGNSGKDDEQGACTLKNGAQCDAWDYYNGKCNPSPATADPLPSWNPGPAKNTILKFVADVTHPTSPSYVPPADRIAVFDNDGTLWTEKPIPAQGAFVFARIAQMAPDHPEWATTQPYAAVLSGDQAAIQQFTPADIEELLYATHAGMKQEEFESIAKAFLATALHPRFKVLYTQTVYQPLLELLDLLRANDFQPYIVSGGGADFMRVFAADVYGIPSDDVVGSSLQYEFQQTSPITGDLIRKAEMVTFDDKELKPVNIQRYIGKRPIMAVGNSDGDLAMFQYTAGGKRPYLNLLIVHDDAEREYDYLSGTDAVMAAAAQSPWMFVSIKQNFKTVFPAPVAIANPATRNCLDRGGQHFTDVRGDGVEYGVCLFGDKACAEQAMLDGACPVGGVKVSGYTTPAALYCIITGGTYAITGNSGAKDEQGACTIGGVQCDVWAHYNGQCGP